MLSEGVQADGGYLVPEEFERQIVTGLDEANVVRSLAKVITTNAERKIPVAATHSAAQWTAENAAYTESNPTFDQKTIDAFKLTDLVKVSIELLQDSAFDLESYIAGEFARAFGIAEEQAFCVGTGTNQPTGIFTANGGTVGVTAAANNAITADELISLVYALKSPYRRNKEDKSQAFYCDIVRLMSMAKRDAEIVDIFSAKFVIEAYVNGVGISELSSISKDIMKGLFLVDVIDYSKLQCLSTAILTIDKIGDVLIDILIKLIDDLKFSSVSIIKVSQSVGL